MNERKGHRTTRMVTLLLGWVTRVSPSTWRYKCQTSIRRSWGLWFAFWSRG